MVVACIGVEQCIIINNVCILYALWMMVGLGLSLCHNFGWWLTVVVPHSGVSFGLLFCTTTDPVSEPTICSTVSSYAISVAPQSSARRGNYGFHGDVASWAIV